MTNHWIDIGNSDCILIIGSNAAENHPVSFKWVTQAREKGATLICVDPRFTRTAAKADLYAGLRSGTDIAFVGGMIRYVLDHDLYHREYVAEYTNASFLIDPRYQGPAELNGLFSGYDPLERRYDKTTWGYQYDPAGLPKRDKTLTDPQCVFQLLKKHFARYDPETVCRITGTSRGQFEKICRVYGATGKPGKAGTILYAMGTTQHTNGTQNVRTYAILQLLLGNMGLAGGGINALRGENNVQGSTDSGLLYDLLPGYLKVPLQSDASLAAYLERVTPKTKDPLSANWWSNYPKYMVSLLKAWYGPAATENNDFGFHYLPKPSPANYSHIALFEAMAAGRIKGLFCWGQNPVVGGPNADLELEALKRLDWLAVADLWETETAGFWKAPGVDPAGIKTEVFLLPAAASFEKEGSVSNSGRWVQWRYQAVSPPGQAKSDGEMISRLILQLKALYAQEKGPASESVRMLHWPYGAHPDLEKVAREINGFDLKTGKLLSGFAQLREDGTTASGNWIYCGSFTEEGNMMVRCGLKDPTGLGLYPQWSWSWPLNRRILYNRASVDLLGRPWDNERPVISWDRAMGKWQGDVPDGGYPPLAVDPEKSKGPFIMQADGVGHLFGPGLGDGPFPESYEPWESPIRNILSAVQYNPVSILWPSERGRQGSARRYPIVATTYRVTEHWQTGGMTRNLPWLNELMPEMFLELSEELGREKGISNGDRVLVESARGRIQALAIVTRRLRPFVIDGKVIHQVGLPWHWGYAGLSKGARANTLTSHMGDANTSIPEYKAFLCNIRKV
jgi:formate dehydrogenase major subunit